jgi:hypothetical protein
MCDSKYDPLAAIEAKRALLNSGKSDEGNMGKKKGVMRLNNELTVIIVGSSQWVGNEERANHPRLEKDK